MGVSIPDPQVPAGSRVTLKIEITTDFNISSFVARQRVNRFLAVNVGNMLAAGEPELVVSNVLRWRVPVLFGTPVKGPLGKVGELVVDVDTGEVIVDDPTQLEEMMDHAEILYTRAASSPGI